MSSNEMSGRVRMQKISSAIQKNRYVSSVSNGLVSTMPALLGGALFTLIDSINVPIYQEFLTKTELKTFTSIPADVTINIISVYAILAIAYSLAKSFNKDAFTAAIVSLMSFLLVTPIGLLADEQTKAFGFTWLGAQGLFVAIIFALLMTRLYVFVVDEGIYIRMPKGVPPTIEKSFAAIAPGMIIITVALLIRGLFTLTKFGNIHEFIFNLVQAPLTNLGGTWWAYLICVFVMSIFWFFGVHGTMVVLSVMIPLWMPAGVENLTAYQQGLEIPNLVPGLSFYMVYTNIGGAMAALGLPLVMLIARSKRYKTLGKLAILPGVFGINEPVIFGTPLVLNVRFLIPIILAPLMTSGLAILATYIGIVPPLKGIGVPLGTPLFVSGFIEGGLKVAFFQLVLAVLSFAIFLPFFRKVDAEAFAEESNKSSAESQNKAEISAN